MSLADDLLALARAWHKMFGEVKCHMQRCPVCADTDWPPAPWVTPR